MTFSSVTLHQLRHISNAQFQLHPRYNVILGSNGCGKTTLLEAIYLLTTGHSFRTRETAPLIQHDKEQMNVYAQTIEGCGLSIQKSIRGPTIAKYDFNICHSSSELARLFPTQVVYQDIFQIIDAGPQVRRSLIDWGMFHVKHSYHAIWQEYRRVLKQRAALLKQRADYRLVYPWDKSLVQLANQLHEHREAYLLKWQTHFYEVLAQMSDLHCTLQYYKGWDRKNTGVDLALLLEQHYDRDLQRQYTQYGPHQADLILEVKSLHMRHGLSRGQQKIILLALKLSQARMLTKPCIYLLDDVVAELDQKHQKRLWECIEHIPGQFYFTLISRELQSLVSEDASKVEIDLSAYLSEG